MRYLFGIARVTEEKTLDCALPAHGGNGTVTPKHLFSPQADPKRFLHVVAFTSDLNSSQSRQLLSWLKAHQPCQSSSPLTHHLVIRRIV